MTNRSARAVRARCLCRPVGTVEVMHGVSSATAHGEDFRGCGPGRGLLRALQRTSWVIGAVIRGDNLCVLIYDGIAAQMLQPFPHEPGATAEPLHPVALTFGDVFVHLASRGAT